MASVTRLIQVLRPQASVQSQKFLSTSVITKSPERFGNGNGESGWKWENGGVGMGGKDAGKATEVKQETGKDKTYKVPEYFGYNQYSFYDVELEVIDKRCPQPKSGLSEYW